MSHLIGGLFTIYNLVKEVDIMGFRFRKSFKILPGVRINLGKKGISTSIGPKGAKINIGPNGTRFTTSIPGTGISYSTRLDKPVGRGMTQCPYCGHKMRKQWDNCPKCHQPLIQTNTNTENLADETSTNNTVFQNNDTENNNAKNGCCGCGCLIAIIFIILCLIGSCGSDKNSTPSDTPATQVETQSVSSNSTEPEKQTSSSETDNVTSNEAATSSETVPVPTNNSSNNTTVNTVPKNNIRYDGEGPNGETIKGNINSKGEKIYHVPGGAFYNRTDAEEWFFTEEDAKAAGYRASKR